MKRARARFRRNRLAVASGVFLIVALLVAFAALPFSLSWYEVQDLQRAVRAAPTTGQIVPYESVQDPLQSNPLASPFKRWGPAAHTGAAWFGYDEVGRSVLFRLVLGWLVSMGIGLGAAAISVTIGVLWGTAAALAGGRTDSLMMRMVDILYGLPYILLVILLKVGLERPLTRGFGDRASLANVVILFVAIGAVSWLTMARVVRGQVLSLREQPFMEAARAAGVGPVRVFWRHLLPNLIGPIVVYATLIIPQAILQESFLSFLGIGIQRPLPSLGQLAADGVQAVNTFVGFWWLITFPCAALVLTLLALNFLGDGLRDALDPKSAEAPMI